MLARYMNHSSGNYNISPNPFIDLSVLLHRRMVLCQRNNFFCFYYFNSAHVGIETWWKAITFVVSHKDVSNDNTYLYVIKLNAVG